MRNISSLQRNQKCLSSDGIRYLGLFFSKAVRGGIYDESRNQLGLNFFILLHRFNRS